MMTRPEMREEGFVPCFKSSDLFAYGYAVITWFSPRRATSSKPPCILVEYIPSVVDARAVRRKDVGRVVASSLAEQIAFHESIGAPVDHQLPLFAGAR